MKTWKIQITLNVDESWIEDGFDASTRLEEIEDKLTYLLPLANECEFKVIANIIKAPSKEEILKLQGF